MREPREAHVADPRQGDCCNGIKVRLHYDSSLLRGREGPHTDAQSHEVAEGLRALCSCTRLSIEQEGLSYHLHAPVVQLHVKARTVLVNLHEARHLQRFCLLVARHGLLSLEGLIICWEVLQAVPSSPSPQQVPPRARRCLRAVAVVSGVLPAVDDEVLPLHEARSLEAGAHLPQVDASALKGSSFRGLALVAPVTSVDEVHRCRGSQQGREQHLVIGDVVLHQQGRFLAVGANSVEILPADTTFAGWKEVLVNTGHEHERPTADEARRERRYGEIFVDCAFLLIANLLQIDEVLEERLGRRM
mmetsp:Transcript_79659/g.184936  ORF Transcript_79659/g.184936 Transcript_79659/m.184936 type:complete len:303 (-) Transcript_79659:585-1493(-)